MDLYVRLTTINTRYDDSSALRIGNKIFCGELVNLAELDWVWHQHKIFSDQGTCFILSLDKNY